MDAKPTTPPLSPGRLVLGLAVIVGGVALLLEAFGIDVPWGIVLPAAVVLVGLILLLNPRSRSSGGWVIVGVVLTVALLVSTLAGRNFGEPADQVEAANFVVGEAVERVVLTIDSGSVTISAFAGVGVEVDRLLNFDDERPVIEHTIVGGVLTIKADCPGGFFSFGSCSVDHELRVSPLVDVEIDSGSGSVRVDGLEGSVRADTGSGRIELADLTGPVVADSGSGGVVLLRVSGDADVGTGSGGIRGTDLSSSELAAETGSGSIDLDFTSVPGNVTAETGSGSVTISVPTGAYHLDLDTSSGSALSTGITEDDSSPNAITVRTGSGSIRIGGR